MVEQSCSPYGSQETKRERERKGLETKYTLKGMPPGIHLFHLDLTSYGFPLPPHHPLGYEPINGIISFGCQSPHDPIISKGPTS
jgi:hypothetical protein